MKSEISLGGRANSADSIDSAGSALLAEGSIEEAIVVTAPVARRPFAERLIRFAVPILIVISPLYFGSNRPVVQLALCMALLFVGGVVFFADTLARRFFSARLVAKSFFRLGLGMLVLTAFQLLPLPQSIVSLLSPRLGEAAKSVGLSWLPLSYSTEATFQQGLWLFALFMFGAAIISRSPQVMLLPLPKRRQRADALRRSSLERERQTDLLADLVERSAIFSGVVCCLIGFAHLSLNLGLLYGVFPPETAPIQLTRTHWPFVNPNHLVMYLEVATILALGRFFRLSYLRGLQRGHNREPARFGLRIVRSPERLGLHSLYLFLALMMFLVSILTFSRGGVLSLIAGLIFLWWLSEKLSPKVMVRVVRERSRREPAFVTALGNFLTKWKMAFTFAISLVAVLILLGDPARNYFTQRLEYGLTASDGDLRLSLLAATLQALIQAPLFGVGLGAWHLGVLPFMTAEMSGFRLDYAHNEYAQFLLEFGIIGAGIVFLVFVGCVSNIVSRYRQTSEIQRKMQIATLSTAVGVPALHAFVEFGFHIPAIALLLVSIVAVLVRVVDQTS